MLWLNFFEASIGAIHKPLAVVLNAGGCREGWLQAELFRAGQRYDLKVNHHSLGKGKKADLSCGDGPQMLAEIKIVGAGYQSKMRHYIDSDARRMKRASTSKTKCFMILLIPDSELDSDSTLKTYLHSCSFGPKPVERSWPGFKLRMWEIDKKCRWKSTLSKRKGRSSGNYK